MIHKHPLTLVLAIVIFGTCISSAIYVFGKSNLSSHRDELLNDLQHLRASAFQYKEKPRFLGGGGGTYTGYRIPSAMLSNDNARYEVISPPTSHTIMLRASSAFGIGTIEMLVDSTGAFHLLRSTGEFQ